MTVQRIGAFAYRMKAGRLASEGHIQELTHQAVDNGLGDGLFELCADMRNVGRNVHANLPQMPI